MLKRSLINVPPRGLLIGKNVGHTKMQLHSMPEKLNAKTLYGFANLQELFPKNASLVSRNGRLYIRTVTTHQPQATVIGHGHDHDHSGTEKHKKSSNEELSTDYSQFNFVESPKETIVSVKTIRKYWELIPLLVVLGLTGFAGVLFVGYSFFTKHDVMRTSKQRHGEDKPWFHANPEKTGKLYVPYEGAHKIPELEQLKKVLNE